MTPATDGDELDARASAGFGLDSDTVLKLAVESSPSGVVVVAPGGTIVLVNRQLEQQFGYSREELLGQPLEMLVPEALRVGHAESRRRFASEGQARAMGAGRELFGRRKDGTEISVEIGLNSVRIRQEYFVVASVVDTTERRRLQTLLDQAARAGTEFERLIAEIALRFIHLPAEEVTTEMQEAHRRVAESLDLDRSTLWVNADGDLRLASSWTRAGLSPPAPDTARSRELFPWTTDALRTGELVFFSNLEEVPDARDRASYQRFGTRSSVIVPLKVDGQIKGAASFAAIRAERSWSPDVLNRVRLVASMFANLLARREAQESLHKALAEVSHLRDQLRAENVYLRQEVQERWGTTNVVGKSPAVESALELVEQVAATDSTVLLLGETGSGKEMFATRIHELSRRKARTMVRVNCAAIPATLMESELFGREKGAYTGAFARQIGRFELAEKSTIFLDEIGDLPPEVQVKLLRVLEERQFERLGSPTSVRVDVRIVAATHRDLQQRIAEGHFREDLYYRLNVFPIRVPPLRERVEDIPLLVWRFVDEFSKAFGKRIDSISKDNMAALQQYPWPGNIRELRNVVERAMITATSPKLTISLPGTSSAAIRRSEKLVDVETAHIRSVLEASRWRIRGAGGAAERLGMQPTTLETRLAKLGLKRPRP